MEKEKLINWINQISIKLLKLLELTTVTIEPTVVFTITTPHHKYTTVHHSTAPLVSRLE